MPGIALKFGNTSWAQQYKKKKISTFGSSYSSREITMVINLINSILEVSECHGEGRRSKIWEIGCVGKMGQTSFLNSVVKAGLTAKSFEPRLEKSERVLQTSGGILSTRRNRQCKSPGCKHTGSILTTAGGQCCWERAWKVKGWRWRRGQIAMGLPEPSGIWILLWEKWGAIGVFWEGTCNVDLRV